MSSFQTAEQLEASLAEYRQELVRVQASKDADRSNDEYEQYENDLNELIQLTLDLLQDAPRTSAPERVTARSGWAPESECEAQWSGDGHWYNATINSEPTSEGFVTVRYPDFNDECESLPLRCVRARPSLAGAVTDDAQSEQQDTAAPQAPYGSVPSEMPKRLRINENDSEQTKQKKRKQQKAFRKHQKQAERDRAAEEKRSQWQNFRQSKVLKSKPGFFSGKRKTSQFELGSSDSSVSVANAPKQPRRSRAPAQRPLDNSNR